MIEKIGNENPEKGKKVNGKKAAIFATALFGALAVPGENAQANIPPNPIENLGHYSAFDFKKDSFLKESKELRPDKEATKKLLEKVNVLSTRMREISVVARSETYTPKELSAEENVLLAQTMRELENIDDLYIKIEESSGGGDGVRPKLEKNIDGLTADNVRRLVHRLEKFFDAYDEEMIQRAMNEFYKLYQEDQKLRELAPEEKEIV